jgi:hypothetical protein
VIRGQEKSGAAAPHSKTSVLSVQSVVNCLSAIFSKRGFTRANGYFLTWETQGELFQLG